MVKQENDPNVGNSLLRTATTRRLGQSKLALTALRSGIQPPVRRVKVDKEKSSGESRVSDLTGSVAESNGGPLIIKEIPERDVHSVALGLSLNSSNTTTSSVSASHKPLGSAVKTNIQPKAFTLPAYQPKNVKKTNMQIHKGISISAPSPMTLDRVQVQMTQEHVVPESKEYKEHKEVTQRMEQEEKDKKELKEKKKQLRNTLKEQVVKERGQGFEAQLEDFQLGDFSVGDLHATNDDEHPPSTRAASNPKEKKKSLVKKLLGKIKPKSPRKKAAGSVYDESKARAEKALSVVEARSMARKALMASKNKKNGGVDAPPRFPVVEIIAKKDASTISDLDASGRRPFPVSEIQTADQARDDDGSVSTLGTPHVFESMNQDPRQVPAKPNHDDPQGRTGLDPSVRDPSTVRLSMGSPTFGQAGPIQDQDTETTASRVLHLDGKALVDQKDSKSFWIEAADNTTYITGDTGAIEVIVDRGCTTAIQSGESVIREGTPIDCALAAATCGVPQIVRNMATQGATSSSNKDTDVDDMESIIDEETLAHLDKLADTHEPGQSPETAADEEQADKSSAKKEDRVVVYEPAAAQAPLSPNSTFAFAIDAAIQKAQAQRNGGSAADDGHAVEEEGCTMSSEAGTAGHESAKSDAVASEEATGENSGKIDPTADLPNSLSPIDEGDEMGSTPLSPRSPTSRRSGKSERQDSRYQTSPFSSCKDSSLQSDKYVDEFQNVEDNALSSSDGTDVQSMPELEGSDKKEKARLQSTPQKSGGFMSTLGGMFWKKQEQPSKDPQGERVIDLTSTNPKSGDHGAFTGMWSSAEESVQSKSQETGSVGSKEDDSAAKHTEYTDESRQSRSTESWTETNPIQTGNSKNKDSAGSKTNFRFDDFFDIAENKLSRSAQGRDSSDYPDDRYATEGDVSPRPVVVGESVDEGSVASAQIPVVQGVEVPAKSKTPSASAATPKARGAGQKKSFDFIDTISEKQESTGMRSTSLLQSKSSDDEQEETKLPDRTSRSSDGSLHGDSEREIIVISESLEENIKGSKLMSKEIHKITYPQPRRSLVKDLPLDTSFEVYEDPDGEEVVCYEVNPFGLMERSPTTSPRTAGTATRAVMSQKFQETPHDSILFDSKDSTSLGASVKTPLSATRGATAAVSDETRVDSFPPSRVASIKSRPTPGDMREGPRGSGSRQRSPTTSPRTAGTATRAVRSQKLEKTPHDSILFDSKDSTSLEASVKTPISATRGATAAESDETIVDSFPPSRVASIKSKPTPGDMREGPRGSGSRRSIVGSVGSVQSLKSQDISADRNKKSSVHQTSSPTEQTKGSNGFAGYFTDGLFDLLSIDSQSVANKGGLSRKYKPSDPDGIPFSQSLGSPRQVDINDSASTALSAAGPESVRTRQSSDENKVLFRSVNEDRDPDVLDYVFEYSELVICGHDQAIVGKDLSKQKPGGRADDSTRKSAAQAASSAVPFPDAVSVLEKERGEEIIHEDDSTGLSSTAKTIPGQRPEPSLGLLCGAVPAYLLYKMNGGDGGPETAEQQVKSSARRDTAAVISSPQNNGIPVTKTLLQPHKTELVSELEESAVDDGLGTVEQNGVESVTKSAPGPEKTSRQPTIVDGASISSDSSLYEKSLNENSPKKQIRSPSRKTEAGASVASNPTHHTHPTQGIRSPQSATRRAAPIPENVSKHDRSLLSKHDPYWDTLSTIASTKGRSTDDYKMKQTSAATPGPIPVEITMTNKSKEESISSASEKTFVDDAKSDCKQVVQSMGKLNTLIGDDPSDSSLSYSFMTSDVYPNKSRGSKEFQKDQTAEDIFVSEPKHIALSSEAPPSQDLHTENQVSRRLSRFGSASGNESIDGPPSHASSVHQPKDNTKSSGSASKNSRVASLIARFEAARDEMDEEESEMSSARQNSTPEEGKPSDSISRNESGFSEDNSALLLTVTRSEAEEQSVEGAQKGQKNSGDGKNGKSLPWVSLFQRKKNEAGGPGKSDRDATIIVPPSSAPRNVSDFSEDNSETIIVPPSSARRNESDFSEDNSALLLNVARSEAEEPSVEGAQKGQIDSGNGKNGESFPRASLFQRKINETGGPEKSDRDATIIVPPSSAPQMSEPPSENSGVTPISLRELASQHSDILPPRTESSDEVVDRVDIAYPIHLPSYHDAPQIDSNFSGEEDVAVAERRVTNSPEGSYTHTAQSMARGVGEIYSAQSTDSESVEEVYDNSVSCENGNEAPPSQYTSVAMAVGAGSVAGGVVDTAANSFRSGGVSRPSGAMFHRSVSWGFEEVYDPPQLRSSPAIPLRDRNGVPPFYENSRGHYEEDVGPSELRNSPSPFRANGHEDPRNNFPGMQSSRSSGASQRSVSWGFEETYDEPVHHRRTPSPEGVEQAYDEQVPQERDFPEENIVPTSHVSQAAIAGAGLGMLAGFEVARTNSPESQRSVSQQGHDLAHSQSPASQKSSMSNTAPMAAGWIQRNNSSGSGTRGGATSPTTWSQSGAAVSSNWKASDHDDKSNFQSRASAVSSNWKTSDNDDKFHFQSSTDSRKVGDEFSLRSGSTYSIGEPLEPHRHVQDIEPEEESQDTYDEEEISEQALISRTLKLSKALLASMNVDDLDPEDDMVKSLLSLATDEDTRLLFKQGANVPHSVTFDSSKKRNTDSKEELVQVTAENFVQVLAESRGLSPEDDTSLQLTSTSQSIEDSVTSGASRDRGIATNSYARASSSSPNIPVSLVLQKGSRSQADQTGNICRQSSDLQAIEATLESVAGVDPVIAARTQTGNATIQSRESTSHASTPSYSVSDVSHDSPMDVNALLSKYDKLAHHIIAQNGQLKSAVSSGESPEQVNEGGSNNTSEVVDKLNDLRVQRSHALARYQSTQVSRSSTSTPQNGGRQQNDASRAPDGQSQTKNPSLPFSSGQYGRRDRDHVRYYSRDSASLERTSGQEAQSTGEAQLPSSFLTSEARGRSKSAEPVRPYAPSYQRKEYDSRDIDAMSSSSDSTRTTPSTKARNLRKQLDEALQASREIRKSHENLGTELSTFKSRFYEKNNEIEFNAVQAMGQAQHHKFENEAPF